MDQNKEFLSDSPKNNLAVIYYCAVQNTIRRPHFVRTQNIKKIKLKPISKLVENIYLKIRNNALCLSLISHDMPAVLFDVSQHEKWG